MMLSELHQLNDGFVNNTFRRDLLKCGQQFPKASVRVIEHAYKEGRFAGNACVVGIFVERRLI